MPCPHCKEKINICPYCEYGMYDEPLEEFEKICPKCGKEIKYCARCGRSFDIKPAYCMKDKALKIIGYIAIFLIVIGVLCLMYYDYVMGQ